MKPFHSPSQKALQRRSTASLRKALAAARRSECHCDSYVGFECGKHRRIDDLEAVLANRFRLGSRLQKRFTIMEKFDA